MTNDIKTKRKQFIVAMEIYENKRIYKLFGKFISTVNISLQIIMAYLILPQDIGVKWQIFSFFIAYFFADFINGLVHMHMDNNDNYESLAGALIANFHLHHKTPLYKKNKIVLVYFNESGSKIWLAGFEIIVVIAITMFHINQIILYILLYFSVLSSIAEVSHYLCHVSNNKLVEILRRSGLLLSKHHHGKHHIEDNVNYAFLNGISDPILNIIAKRFCLGYKNRTDKHYEYYQGKGGSKK